MLYLLQQPFLKSTFNNFGTLCSLIVQRIHTRVKATLIMSPQEFIKDVLRLPQDDDFDKVPSADVIIRDLKQLGYDESNKEFTSSSRFLKMNLAAFWSTLFMPINRCLTPKKGSQDKCSLDVLKIFHGVAYGKRYDFSVMIWKEFVRVVRSKSTYTYVPFLRFLKLIIGKFMEKVPGITTRSHDGCPNNKEMQRLSKKCGNTCVKALRIPEELLVYADPQSSAVVDYRSKNPMDPAAPLEPTPQGRIASKVGVGSEGAGELELELASRINRNVSSQAVNDSNENNIPEGGGVSFIGVVEESVVKTAPKKRKDRSTTIGSSRVATSSVGPSTANTPVSVDNIERDSSSPLEHAHTPPSHLSSSQKDLISLPSSSDTHNTSTLPPDEHQKYSYMDLCTMLRKKIHDEPQENSLRANLYQLLTLVVSGNTTPEMDQELTQMGNGNEGNSSKSQQDLQGHGSSEVPTNTVPVEEVVEGSYEETVEVKIAEISDQKQVTSDVVRDWDPMKGILGASSSCLKDEREVLNIKVYQRKKQKASQEDEVVKEDEQQTENSDTSSDDLLTMFLRKRKPDKEVGPSKKRRRIHESVSDKEEDIQDQTREAPRKTREIQNNCHQCGSDKLLVYCSSCKERFYCIQCINKWYPQLQETDIAKQCPFCRGNCNCNQCLNSRIKMPDINFDNNVKLQHLHYLFSKLYPFLQQICEEQKVELDMEANAQGVSLSSVTTKQSNHPIEDRIYCDHCSTSIFDLFRRCPECDYDLCLSCCREIRNNKPLNKVGDFGRCKEHWHVGENTPTTANCVTKDNGSICCKNCNSALKLRHIFRKDWVKTLEEKAADYMSKTVNQSDIESQQLEINPDTCLKAASREGSDDNFLYHPLLENFLENAGLMRFRLHWTKGHPVIFRNVLKQTRGLSWEPGVMSRAVNDESSTSDCSKYVINCMPGSKVKVTASNFFTWYTEGKQERKTPIMLKLNDVPPEDDYVTALPRYYDEFVYALPLREYTHPEKGILNLATKLPQDRPLPDLGPKSYIAYGIADELRIGSSATNLHCDMTDAAVNILVHTSDVYPGNEEGTGGALWDIFRREDVKKLEEYLLHHYTEFRYPCGCPADKVYNPIHDHTFYLTSEHKRKLKEEHGVEPWTFTQHIGEAVLIPAGCPHQVRNLKSCTKVAMDFVSPENIQECIRLTEQFRKLPAGHFTVTDKLEIKRMVLHAMDKTLEDLCKISK